MIRKISDVHDKIRTDIATVDGWPVEVPAALQGITIIEPA